MATMILGSATVTGQHGYAQKIEAGGHEFQADEPQRRGGTNTGPAPFDLMLSSLGACTAITLRMYSERKQWKLGTIGVRTRLLQEPDQPQRIERRISVSEPIDAEQHAKLLEIAAKTPVTRLIAGGIAIDTLVGE